MGAEPAFLDTNVLVYANQSRAGKHAAALEWLRHAEREEAELRISGQVMREYLAVVTRPTNGEPPLSTRMALDRVREFELRFRVAEDGPIVRRELHKLLTAHAAAGKQIHDANIVATMLAYGVGRLMTFNVSDFRRFSAHIQIEHAPG